MNKTKMAAKYKLGRPVKKSTLKDKKKTYQAEITDYDFNDTTDFINVKKPLKLKDLGFTLPEIPPTQVVSIRLPTILLNQIRALSSQSDISYQAMIKIFLSSAVAQAKKKAG